LIGEKMGDPREGSGSGIVLEQFWGSPGAAWG